MRIWEEFGRIVGNIVQLIKRIDSSNPYYPNKGDRNHDHEKGQRVLGLV